MSDNFFGNVDTNIEQAEDFLGGDFSALESDIYPVTIKIAYLTKSRSGAVGLNLEFAIDGSEQTRTLTTYMTRKTGENYYVKDGKKYMMPGWSLGDSISLMVESKGLVQAARQEKQVELWDNDAKKRLPTNVPVYVNWTGKRIYLGILNELANKWVNGAPTSETVNRNVIDKAFHINSKNTLAEALKKEPATFYDRWLERNKGTVRDTTNKNLPSTTAPGNAAMTNAPSGDGGASAAADLFG